MDEATRVSPQSVNSEIKRGVNEPRSFLVVSPRLCQSRGPSQELAIPGLTGVPCQTWGRRRSGAAKAHLRDPWRRRRWCFVDQTSNPSLGCRASPACRRKAMDRESGRRRNVTGRMPLTGTSGSVSKCVGDRRGLPGPEPSHRQNVGVCRTVLASAKMNEAASGNHGFSMLVYCVARSLKKATFCC